MAEDAAQVKRLQVAGAQSPDVGKGTARIGQLALQELGLHEGEVVEIVEADHCGACAGVVRGR